MGAPIPISTYRRRRKRQWQPIAASGLLILLAAIVLGGLVAPAVMSLSWLGDVLK